MEAAHDHRVPSLQGEKMNAIACCLIIGICGVSGAGKTEITKLLAERLGDATTIHWDDYDSLPSYQEPEDYLAWFNSDKDYAAWKSPQLAKALEKLKNIKSVKHPTEEKEQLPSPIVIFDAPLGYEHTETGKFIDFLVFIDVPADILLIRRLQRDHLNGNPVDPQKINEELDYYSKFSRPLYLDTDRAKNSADLVLDGTLPKNEIVEKILGATAQLRKEKGA